MGIPVLDLQVNGLVLLVVCPGSGYAGENVKGDLAVGLGIFDLGELVGGFGGGVVGSLVLKGPRDAALEDECF